MKTNVVSMSVTKSMKMYTEDLKGEFWFWIRLWVACILNECVKKATKDSIKETVFYFGTHVFSKDSFKMIKEESYSIHDCIVDIINDLLLKGAVRLKLAEVCEVDDRGRKIFKVDFGQHASCAVAGVDNTVGKARHRLSSMIDFCAEEKIKLTGNNLRMLQDARLIIDLCTSTCTDVKFKQALTRVEELLPGTLEWLFGNITFSEEEIE